MAIVTIRVDDDLKVRMESLKEVNWSEVARKAIVQKIKDIELWESVDVALMRKASSNADSLSRKVEGWNSTSEIRRWRERDQR